MYCYTVKAVSLSSLLFLLFSHSRPQVELFSFHVFLPLLYQHLPSCKSRQSGHNWSCSCWPVIFSRVAIIKPFWWRQRRSQNVVRRHSKEVLKELHKNRWQVSPHWYCFYESCFLISSSNAYVNTQVVYLSCLKAEQQRSCSDEGHVGLFSELHWTH